MIWLLTYLLTGFGTALTYNELTRWYTGEPVDTYEYFMAIFVWPWAWYILLRDCRNG